MISICARLLARIVRWCLAAAAVLLVIWAFARVAGRTLRSGEEAAAVELTLMHWSGEGGQEEDAIVETLIADFEARQPGVRVRRINPGDAASYYNKLQTMAAAGSPPDVFYLGAERLAAFAAAGLARPLDRLLEEDRLSAAAGELDAGAALRLEDFYPVTVQAFRFDGQASGRGALYGVPKDFTTIGFYANKELFARAGLKLPPPDWTWDDFIAICRRIGELEGCTGAEFVTWPMMLRLYLRTEGVDLVSPDFQTLRLREPEVYGALERLRAWRHDESGSLTSGKSKVATGASVFLTGRVGLAGPFGRWVVPSYRKISGFDWDFLPLPRGKTQANAVATVAWAISDRCAHPQEAWALVRHLCGPRSQALAAPLGLAVPALRAVAESPAFLTAGAKPLNSRAFLSQAEYAQVVAWPADPKFEARLENRMNQALKTGDLSLAEAIERFEEDWEMERSSPLRRAAFAPLPWRALAWGGGAAAALLVVGGAWWWRRGAGGGLRLREQLAGVALTSPWLAGFALFLAFPILLSLLLSLSRWSGITTLDRAQWVGFANYAELLGFDRRFRVCLRVSAYYALLAVPLGQAFALASALLLSQRTRAAGLFRSAWYLPSVLAGVGVAVLWRWVFDGDHGLLNGGMRAPLAAFGLRPPRWLDQDAAAWGPPAFALMSLWTTGGAMVIYLAGLKGIPADLYQAAAIDGCGPWRRFRHVTLPMLSPVIFFNVVMAVIGSFQVFTQAFVMTGGEPGDLTRFYVLYLYNQAFEFYEMGYASALAWLLLLLILALTFLIFRGGRRLVHYEALKA